MKTRILMTCLIIVLMAGCQMTSSSPYPGVAGSPTVTGDVELQPFPFADELQKVLDDGLKASNGAGISAAVIVPGYQPWVGVMVGVCILVVILAPAIAYLSEHPNFSLFST